MDNLLTCKYCGYQGKQLHQHLKAVHNQTIKEYREKFDEFEMSQIGFNPVPMQSPINGQVICKICNKEGKNLSQRIIYYHNMTIDQYRKLYPSARISINTKFNFGYNKQRKQFLTLQQKLICGQTVYCLDFKQKNKNIEFDVKYWHRDKEKDKIRDQILKKRGYWILRISQEQFDHDKELVIYNCLEFLK